MARCPLCSERPAKRFCPAKNVRICPVCCGSRREVDIDCPTSCHFLLAGRAYENDQREPEPQLTAAVQQLDKGFIYRQTPILNSICQSIHNERTEAPWLVDTDVIEVLKNLAATMKTLSSGIYYESLPESGIRVSLYRRLKGLFDGFMQPEPQGGLEQSLRVSEAVDILNFLTITATVNSNSRPRSRQYLDMLAGMANQAAEQPQRSSLIVP
jgi:hypothetical protein